jgi:hypothetical protein
MLFASAMVALHEGQKVRLSDWTGYWFKEDGIVKVQMKNGDVLETPNITRYQERDDWQIVSSVGLGFDFAINALKNGKAVCRISSPTFFYQIIYQDSEPIIILSVKDTLKQARVCFSETDMVAEDWQVYNH